MAAGAHAGVIVPFQSTETGLLQLTSATTSHAVATGTGVSTLGLFQVTGSQDSDFTYPLNQMVSKRRIRPRGQGPGFGFHFLADE